MAFTAGHSAPAHNYFLPVRCATLIEEAASPSSPVGLAPECPSSIFRIATF